MLHLGSTPIANGEILKYNAHNLFDYKFSDHILNDVSWLRTEPFSWHLASVYVEAYGYLLNEYNAATVVMNATKVGSPTIGTDGVVSGFSASNYLTLPTQFAPASDTWEVYCKVTTGSAVTGTQVILGDAVNTTDNFALWVKDGIFKVNYNGTTYTGTYGVEINKEYWLKVTYSDTTLKLYYKLEEGEYIEDISSTVGATLTSTSLRLGNDADGLYWTGSIDLRDCHIKVGGAYTWNGELYRASTNGLRIASAEQEQYFINMFTTTGVAWYYLIDKDGKRFKLPRTTHYDPTQAQTVTTYLYFYVGEYARASVEQMAGVALEKLNALGDTVKETYKGSDSWYRVWSDGWIEQGGVKAIGTTSGTSVALIKSFASTNYQVILTMNSSAYATSGWGYLINTESQFTVYNNNSSSVRDCSWYACGY